MQRTSAILPIMPEVVGLVLALDLVVLVEEAGQGPTVLVVHLEDGLLLLRSGARPAELGLPMQSVRWRFGVSVLRPAELALPLQAVRWRFGASVLGRARRSSACRASCRARPAELGHSY